MAVEQLRRAVLLGVLLTGGVAVWLCSSASRDRPSPESGPAIPRGEPASQPVAPTDAVVVTGRCIDARTRAPERCEVRVHATRAFDPWQPGPQSTQTAAVHTDTDGRFRVVIPRLLPSDVSRVGIGAEDRVTSWHEVPAGTEHDLGDVAMLRGTRVGGRVVDTSGAPRAAVEIVFWSNEDNFARRRCITAADGTFHAEDGFPPGTWTLDTGHAVALRSPLVMEVDEDVAAVDLQVVVFASGEVPELEGIVLDQDHQPVPGATVLRGVVTDTSGRFRIVGGPAGEWARDGKLSVYPEAAGCYAWPARQDLALGTKTAALRVQRSAAPTLEVTLAERATGQAIELFDVVGARPAPPSVDWGDRPGSDGKARAFGPHPGGRARLEGLGPGEHVVAVRPHGDLASLVQIARVTLPADPPALALTLPAPATRWLEVVTPDARPVIDSCVEVLLPLDDGELSLRARVIASLGDWWPSGGPHALLVSSTRTDAQGRAELRGPADRPLDLRITGRHRPAVRGAVRLAGPPLQVTVRPGGTLAGRLPPGLRHGLGDGKADGRRSVRATPDWAAAIGAVRDVPGLVLARPRPGPTQWSPLPPHGYAFPIGHDGEFQISGVNSGTWRVQLDWPTSRGAVVLGTAHVTRDGRVDFLVLDAPRLAPATLTGLVRADDRPWAQRRVLLQAVKLRAVASCDAGIECATDAHGRFTAVLLPGRWQIAVAAQGTPQPRRTEWITLPGEIDLDPGAKLDADFAFPRRRLTAQVVDGSGRPQAFLRLDARAGDEFVDVLTDHEGRFVIDPVFVDRIELTTRGPEPASGSWRADTSIGSLRVPAEPRDPSVIHVAK